MGDSNNTALAAILNPAATLGTLGSGGYQALSGEQARKKAKKETSRAAADLDRQQADLKYKENLEAQRKNRLNQFSMERRASLLKGTGRPSLLTGPLGLPSGGAGGQKSLLGQ